MRNSRSYTAETININDPSPLPNVERPETQTQVQSASQQNSAAAQQIGSTKHGLLKAGWTLTTKLAAWTVRKIKTSRARTINDISADFVYVNVHSTQENQSPSAQPLSSEMEIFQEIEVRRRR
ncbi:hypothetical protein [Parashewanella tropica]|uniref:hypothetical protein n=1 Tax=Parashewanella tropica TaxID=2547970 RepID=UPI001059267A|nr:hypothetical protein [Parashewanella tropica]